MNLEEYFENARGFGVLSTADNKGKVNAAIYGRPHFMNENSVAFIASDRLTHANLKKNPSAIYLFKEEGVYKGYRLYLTKTHEVKDSPLIEQIRRKKYKGLTHHYETASKFLVHFKVDKVLPLSGVGK
ncbi:MAG TPA: pyridoxamine 5'-phosphate oxidase family protein [Smithella sp.]|nr:pyridoxamine 5'-phosphate oxidase family protein [Smithella sp.]